MGEPFKVILVRHGESEWTKNNLFCGWYDAPLSARGREEARRCGETLRAAGASFDVAFTSLLTRAEETLEIIKGQIGQPRLETVRDWRLNERHYGDLTGHNKEQMAAKYGPEQVQVWRRQFDVLPPPMEASHPYYAGIVNNPKLKQPGVAFPRVESLKTAMARMLPFWTEVIAPQILEGKRVLIVTHGTTLRGLVKHVDGVGDDDIMKLNIPTGLPFYYELDHSLKPVVSMKFYSDNETVAKAMRLVASITHTDA